MTPRLALCVVALWAGSALADSRRIAIVVGNNAGAGDLAPLRYAENDAGKMARVLVELGEVGSDDLILLQGRKVAQLESAIGDARERVQFLKRSPDTRTLLLFYFSGHSDGEAIEMSGEKLPYARLKALLNGTGADVRVSIVDACRSGGGFRNKGGRPVDPFTIKLTDTLVATGEAFITSSAADEAALESSEVMGSYFTHNFISGLRGAADASGDKQVTLAEAYQYAYDRTVSATAGMPVGAQHPNYDYRISGQGELVLSTLSRPSAVLVLPDGSDRSLVTDLRRDQVIVEVPAGPMREVALTPGEYGVRLFKDGKSFGGRVQLAEGARRQVKWEDLTALSSAVAVAAKGGEVSRAVEAPRAGEVLERRTVLQATVGVFRPATGDLPVKLGGKLTFEPTSGPGLTFTAQFGTVNTGAKAETSLGVRAGWRYALQFGPLWLGLGAELGTTVFWQYSATAPTQTSLANDFELAPRVTVRLHVAGPLWAVLDAEAGLLLVRLNDQVTPLFNPAGSVGLAVAF